MKYLRYHLHNISPVRITDDSRSEAGETVSVNYIPGSALRGYLITEIAKDPELFGRFKKELFSDAVHFGNAYLAVDGRALLPSPKGFYEDKTVATGKKKIENVVISGDFDEGYKRAGLGSFSDIDFSEGVIRFYSVPAGSEMRIRLGKDQNLFRNGFIREGQDFIGTIGFEDEELGEIFLDALKEKTILIGNSRSAGLGKCRVANADFADLPLYQECLPKTDVTGFIYLYLASDLVMRNENGEYAGLDIRELEEILGVTDLEVQNCSTSVRDVHGYNRTLGIRLPSTPVYEKGSVFKLCFNGVLRAEKMREAVAAGIGERRNEGYGQVLFFDAAYEKLSFKEKGEAVKITHADIRQEAEDQAVLKMIAKTAYRNALEQKMQEYVVESARNYGGISSSKQRAIEPIIVSNRMNFEEAKRLLVEYYEHENQKQNAERRQVKRGNINKSGQHVMEILDKPLAELLKVSTAEDGKMMGIPVSDLLDHEEEGRLKLELILSELRFDNKGEM